ncbi:PstS family phosphate ABC transporter substrate-binding protein [Nocardia callitridis]|uniref:Substrate-binding domain-containing protein n=1 Tax=Nocardia callitridis TaxID=648753 RepID=A0ABP9KEI7_9NOCA
MGGEFFVQYLLPVVGIVIPVAAFLWEFVIIGRKRLGYRVQMDTPVTGSIESVFPGVLPQLRPSSGESTPDLQDLSIVLVRIENSGFADIGGSDYRGPEGSLVGLHLRFPHRRVMGMAVTELSDDGLADSLVPGAGIAVREDTGGHIGVIDLPRVPLDRGDHYKILAILQRSRGTGEYPAPAVVGGISGGRVVQTRNRIGVPKMMVALTVFLVLVIIAQLAVNAAQPPPTPLDCASGKLTLLGSSAFEQVMKDAADQYANRCTGAEFAEEFEGSERGLDRLAEHAAPDPGSITISDGPKGDGYPMLTPRPLALSLFSVIVDRGVGVDALSTEQIRDLYQGKVGNWREVGGRDLPVVLVNRIPGSGTRNTFERRLLGAGQPERPHVSCTALKGAEQRDGAHCDAQVTADMTKAVAQIPGAVGYAEYSEAERAKLTSVAIDGVGANRDSAIDRSYPFWGVEYAYSYGELPADSLAASFLRFLTDQAGKDVLREHGNAPCAELPDPGRCSPEF